MTNDDAFELADQYYLGPAIAMQAERAAQARADHYNDLRSTALSAALAIHGHTSDHIQVLLSAEAFLAFLKVE